MKANITVRRHLVAFACVTALGSTVQAAEWHLPPLQQQGAVEFVSGGVDTDTARAIEREGRHWPVTLEFAVADRPVNDYLADVQVRIDDAHGRTVLQTTADGPFLLAKLAPGHYRVHATFAGKTLQRELAVNAGTPQHDVFLWPHGYLNREG